MLFRSKSLKGKNALAFAGIAKPKVFYNEIQNLGIHLVETLSFSDHHNFLPKDLHKIATVAKRKDAQYLLCTQKDWVKLQDYNFDLPLVCLGQEIILDGQEELTQVIHRQVQRKVSP